MNITKEKLIEECEIFINKIRFANACTSILDTLSHNKNSPVWKREYEIAPVFFTITQMSLKRTILMETAKIFEVRKENIRIPKLCKQCKNLKLFRKRKSSISIQKLIEHCKYSKLFEKSSLSQYTQLLDSLNPTIKNLLRHRDKFLAHNDKKYFTNPNLLTKDFPISIYGKDRRTIEQSKNNSLAIDYENGIIDLLGYAFSICENILNALTGENEKRQISYTNVHDINELFMVLNKYDVKDT